MACPVKVSLQCTEKSHRHAHRKSCEETGREWSFAATNHGMPGVIGNWKKQGSISP